MTEYTYMYVLRYFLKSSQNDWFLIKMHFLISLIKNCHFVQQRSIFLNCNIFSFLLSKMDCIIRILSGLHWNFYFKKQGGLFIWFHPFSWVFVTFKVWIRLNISILMKMFKVLIMFHFYTNFKKGSNENKTSTQDTIRKGSRKNMEQLPNKTIWEWLNAQNIKDYM